VLFGNLPTKTFYSDAAMPDEQVESLTQELMARMAEIGHPHIPGSECGVLCVPDAAVQIRRKVDLMLSCAHRSAPPPNSAAPNSCKVRRLSTEKRDGFRRSNWA
jgi:hypothetical protein